MKKISILIYALSSLLFGSGCYTNYSYVDTHHTETTINQQIKSKKVKIVSKLYLKYIEENNSSYIIAWLKSPNRKNDTKDTIDIESIYAPFLIEKDSRYPNSFIIKNLQILSQDYNVKQQLISVIDILQFKNRNESYRALTANGKIEIDESITSKGIHISYGDLFNKDIKNEAIKYTESDISVMPSNDCAIWDSIYATQKIEIEQKLLDMNIVDNRAFNLTRLDEKLDAKHWFLELGTDIKEWKVGKRESKLSLTEASELFSAKQQELKSIFDDADELEKWVKKNEQFIQYLDVLLEDNSLDDEVSKKLFSMLGYVNNITTTNVLGRIVLNGEIDEKERFRGIMAFKNTSAPIDDDTLSDILDYGLSSDNGNDFIQNSLGMLLGTIAKERIDRVAEQAKRIENSIINTMQTKENKTISLISASNMLESASKNIIDAVDSVMLTSEDSYTRAKSANALNRIGKSNVTTEQFSNLIKNEQNINTQSELIEASVSANGFNSDSKFRTFLVEKAYSRKDVSLNRVSALKTLLKTDYGKNQTEKKSIRKMMLGEKNSDIIKLLKKLYRR